MNAYFKGDEEFNINLAKLFYSVASIDKVVVDEEIAFFKAIIRKEWETNKVLDKPQIEQVFGVFDSLVESKTDAEECFESFRAYMLKSNGLFSPFIKNLIWKTADGIASAFADKNKSEVILLAKLKSLLLNLPDEES
jgi:hypothetical protein